MHSRASSVSIVNQLLSVASGSLFCGRGGHPPGSSPGRPLWMASSCASLTRNGRRSLGTVTASG